MSNAVELSTFPASVEQEIAMLYVKTQDLTGKSPVDIYNMYWDAYNKILADQHEKLNAKWPNQKTEVTRRF